jgi:hypothetical protein
MNFSYPNFLLVKMAGITLQQQNPFFLFSSVTTALFLSFTYSIPTLFPVLYRNPLLFFASSVITSVDSRDQNVQETPTNERC